MNSQALSELSEKTEEDEEDSSNEDESMLSMQSCSPGSAERMDEPMVVGSPLSPIQMLQRRTRQRLVSESELSDTDSLPGTLTEVG